MVFTENDVAFVYDRLGRHREALHHFTRSWQLNLDLGYSRGAAIAYRIKLRANREIRAANRELEAARRRVEELSLTDALTGLANRRAIEERLQAEYRRTARFDRPFSIVMADIDHFKAINDSFGHGIGDAVLRELADRLRAVVRSVDLAGRWGGEEFLLVLPDTVQCADEALYRGKRAGRNRVVSAAPGAAVNQRQVE